MRIEIKETPESGLSLQRAAVILQNERDHHWRGMQLIQPEADQIARKALWKRTRKALRWLGKVAASERHIEEVVCKRDGLDYATYEPPS